LNKLILILTVFIVTGGEVSAQITSGKITFERKTNLYKKFKKWGDVQDWIKESDKIKIDY